MGRSVRKTARVVNVWTLQLSLVEMTGASPYLGDSGTLYYIVLKIFWDCLTVGMKGKQLCVSSGPEEAPVFVDSAGGSSNGRTGAFEALNLGPNPSPPALHANGDRGSLEHLYLRHGVKR